MKKILTILVAGLFMVGLHACSTTCGPATGTKGTPISYPVGKTEQNTPRSQK